MKDCRCYKDGKCVKFSKTGRECKPSTEEDFEHRLETCDVNEVCGEASIFGNALYVITDEDIEKLKAGKVLYDVDEYGTFIIYKPGK